jgi:phosphoenolpyruvate carboxylase
VADPHAALLKLTVADEIENALSYYRITFLRELPGLYDDIEADIASLRRTSGGRCAVCADGQLDRRRPRRQPERQRHTMEHALTRAGHHHPRLLSRRSHTLGAELSMSTLMIACSPELQALADRSTPPTTAPTNPTAAP